ncbi:MAG: NAD(P)/FAD-dependent oxidoreductase [Chloroflexi bacterium]|nr:NAD(P)/FAD-dependent oxidoreductase [Chloroflexota bacterium]
MPLPLQIVIVGGGAAGFFAAITAAEADLHHRILLLEKSKHLLAKVRISGGGRCNVTHACFDPVALIQNYPRGGAALRGPLTRFQPQDTIDWFAARGARLKTEADGRIFPVSDKSQTIIDCLMNSAAKARVEIQTEVSIETITHSNAGFLLRLKNGESLRADRLLLATGNNRHGQAWAASLGHTLAPLVPSLFTFNIEDVRLAGLAGVAVAQAQLTLGPLTQTGPTLITHWGLSGPAVLKLSAWGARLLHDCGYNAELKINWLPDFDESELLEKLTATRAEHPKRLVVNHSPFPLPARLWERLAAAAGVAANLRWAGLSKQATGALIDQLRRGSYQITGKSTFKEEFVTCGGVNLGEVNFKTMESRLCPGLYFAGEVLDIDGVTGGFNFQSAWTTAWLAGKAMAL